jgi:hypothetical protein
MFPARISPAQGPAAAISGVVMALLLSGCANPGPPKPPSLHLPKPAEGLQATRIGKRVLLSFTVPDETTDGGATRPPLAAVVCREDSVSPESPCREVLRAPVKPGAANVADSLPPGLASGEARLMVYRVELLNGNGRGAGNSASVFALAGMAPPATGAIAVLPRRNAAQITWDQQAQSPDTEIRVERTLIATADGPVPVTSNKKTPAPEAQKPGRTLKQATLSSGTGLAKDPGGLIDRGIHDGDTVRYVAERLRTVSLAVPTTRTAGGKVESQGGMRLESFELRGEPSPAATFEFHDTAPPAAPTGLAAIPGGGFGQPATIDLSWDTSPEADLLGYHVYRAEQSPGAAFVRLNTVPVVGLSFRDLTARPNGAYRYRVTAVDVRHHESQPSGEVREQLTQ